MKKIVLPMGVLLLAFALLTGCTTQKQEDETSSEEKTKEEAKVCCESYGYGSEMKKCCETYEWTEPGQCGTEEGMVGGGKEVVDDSKCE
jgi:hypothetical protein